MRDQEASSGAEACTGDAVLAQWPVAVGSLARTRPQIAAETVGAAGKGLSTGVDTLCTSLFTGPCPLSSPSLRTWTANR